MAPRELSVQELKQRRHFLLYRVNKIREEKFGVCVFIPSEKVYLHEIDYRYSWDNVYPLPRLWDEIELITAQIENQSLLKKRPFDVLLDADELEHFPKKRAFFRKLE